MSEQTPLQPPVQPEKKRRGLTFPTGPLGGKGTPPMTGLQDLTQEEQAAPPPVQPTSPPPPSNSNNLSTSQQVNKLTSRNVDKATSQLVDNNNSVNMDEGLPTIALDVEALLADLVEKSKTPLKNPNGRAPDALIGVLEDWLGDNWRTRVTKQQLMTRAIALVAYELSTGEKLVTFGFPALDLERP